MLKVTKIEHHRVNTSYTIELTPELLSEIYPDLEDFEVAKLMKNIASGKVKIDDVIEEAIDNDVELNWDPEKNDWWTVEKGGFDVTFKIEKTD
jgi:hypothetical protein